MNKKEYNKKYYKEHRNERLAHKKLYYKEHRDERLASMRQYNKEHRDEIMAYQKQWNETHKSKKLAYDKRWYETHRDEILAHYKKHRDKMLAHEKQWREQNKDRWHEIAKKHNSKRKRGLGFVPLNKPFEGSEAHHICLTFVIYIPREMHKSIYHNVWTGKNMDKINALAFDYLLETKILEIND